VSSVQLPDFVFLELFGRYLDHVNETGVL
jgi:hypothetical protein